MPHFKGKAILTFGLSDVEGNDIAVIGSDIGLLRKPYGPEYHYEIVGSNKTACDGAEQAALDAGFDVWGNFENLYQDVYQVAKEIADKLKLTVKPGIRHQTQKKLFKQLMPGHG